MHSFLKPVKFIKVEACGNDFIVFMNQTEDTKIPIKNQCVKLCQRNFGIGADGIIFLNKINNNWQMSLYNADGSIAQNCGNGLRCVALLLMEEEKKDEITIYFNNFAYKACKKGDDIAVVMQDAVVKKQGDNLFYVSLGNEHLVTFLKEENTIEPKLDDKYNLGFVWFNQQKEICSKVYERGVGLTKSCGTGAMAAFAALSFVYEDLLGKPYFVHQEGGKLLITANKTENKDRFSIIQQGPARKVFYGFMSIMV